MLKLGVQPDLAVTLSNACHPHVVKESAPSSELVMAAI